MKKLTLIFLSISSFCSSEIPKSIPKDSYVIVEYVKPIFSISPKIFRVNEFLFFENMNSHISYKGHIWKPILIYHDKNCPCLKKLSS